MKTGVVQGGTLSPALFNYYLADFPTPPPNIKLIKYADYITIYTSGPVVSDLINGLNIYLSQVLNYIKKTDSVIGQIYSNTLHARYSRASLTSTGEFGRPSTTAGKEANGVMKTGVVQGGTLSTALFNYYLADFPTPPPNIKLIKYADDITIYTSGPVVSVRINGLNIYLSQVLNYINKIKLTVSTAKSTVTPFTPDTHEHHLHPQVKLADQVLQLVKKPTVSWVTLDTHLTFTQLCKNIAVKV